MGAYECIEVPGLDRSCCRLCEDKWLEAQTNPVVRMMRYFVVCSECGNKRCPRAKDHRLPCSGSNAPGQPSSDYE